MTTTNLQKLLRILSDGKCHSGEELGDNLGITRSAIWKLIKQLKDFDIAIEAKTNHGYQITGGLELLSVNKIKKHLNDAHLILAKNITIFDQIDSTNNYLMQHIHGQTKQPIICLAESQTAGRGRFGRQWHSPFGKNIYFSLLKHFNCDISELSGLSLIIGATVVNTLKQYGIEEAITLKWPNDVLYDNQKLCGILIELAGESNHQCAAVIGVGINIDLPTSASQQINQAWTDLKKISKQPIARNQLVALLINNIIDALKSFEQDGLKPLVKLWPKLDQSYHKPVKILFGKEIITGINHGIDERGRFLLKDNSGKIHVYSSGEVSLRTT